MFKDFCAILKDTHFYLGLHVCLKICCGSERVSERVSLTMHFEFLHGLIFVRDRIELFSL